MANPLTKLKMALGTRLCTNSKTSDDASPSVDVSATPSETDPATMASGCRVLVKVESPSEASSGLRLFNSGSRSSTMKMCCICLDSMKPGRGHALFTAECSHSFHFHCIALSIKHGNQLCPVCRSKWKDMPFQAPQSPQIPHGRARISPSVIWPHNVDHTFISWPLPRTNSNQATELTTFDDDEPLDSQRGTIQDLSIGKIEIKTYPEFPVIGRLASEDNFAILIHLKAPQANTQANSTASSRAPVDLVTVLDVSGSMAGTKLALLKHAMRFVIQNLGPSDRLSVVTFSSTAHRLFNLRRMSDSGRQLALQAINSLVSRGGTNISDGLRKGAKVIEERKDKNPVCSIMLLSDGQDNFFFTSSRDHREGPPDYRLLVPQSILRVPVHTFGFGGDHDSMCMHSISETSGGTFSFVESEGVIQDAFAQCIGGLLSVLVQNAHVQMQSSHPGVRLTQIKSGNYGSTTSIDQLSGMIAVGDLYADEERNFLVFLKVPSVLTSDTAAFALLTVYCIYSDVSTNKVACVEGEVVSIKRPVFVGARTMSFEVDREMNRVNAAEDMTEARNAAERGEFSKAVGILERRRRLLSESLSGRSGDRICTSLDADLREMQKRMASRQRYEDSGRAYMLSGLSSHSWQRATARGDSTEISGGRTHAYQTQSMVQMLHRSQVFSVPPRPPQPR